MQRCLSSRDGQMIDLKTTNVRDAARITESIQDVYFNQCVDFLARMIEKYGDVLTQAEERKTA